MQVLGRIASALAANAFGQAVTVGSQLLLTPLFFRFWGAAQYGEWLILSSIPAYLTMADMGFGSAAGNEMTMRAGAGDRRGAQQTFLGALLVVAWASALVLLIGVLAALAAFHFRVPSTPSITAHDAAFILLALSGAVALGFAGGLVSAGFRCCERNALGISLANVARLVEAVLQGGLLLLGQSPLWVCLGAVLVKAVMLLVQLGILMRTCPWLFAPGVQVDRSIVQRLIRPALGFLAFPLGNALALQGPILVVGAVFGGAGVAMFSTLRTLARIPMQITNMFNSSVWPEMTRAWGAGDLALLRKLHRASWGVTLMLILMMGTGLALLGRWVVHMWLGPQAGFDPFVFLALVLITVLCAAWGASSVVLAAINQHLRMALMYLVVNAVCIAIAAVAGPAFGWRGILAPLLLAELALILWVMPKTLRVSGDSVALFYRAVARETAGRLLKRVRRSG